MSAEASLSAMARSKLTALPARSWARPERFRVSCMTSAENPSFCRLVTVKHTPLTATLSPILRSSNAVLAWMCSTAEWVPGWTRAMRPTSSTIPVNMGFHLAFDQNILS